MYMARTRALIHTQKNMFVLARITRALSCSCSICAKVYVIISQRGYAHTFQLLHGIGAHARNWTKRNEEQQRRAAAISQLFYSILAPRYYKYISAYIYLQCCVVLRSWVFVSACMIRTHATRMACCCCLLLILARCLLGLPDSGSAGTHCCCTNANNITGKSGCRILH